MGIHNQESEARKQLYEMTMRKNETVDELFHKMFNLWQQAKTSERERIDQFVTSLRPYLSNFITNMRFSTVRAAFDEIRLTEIRKKVIYNKYLRSNPKINTSRNSQFFQNKNNNNNKLRNFAPSDNINTNTNSNAHPNEKLKPCAKKSSNWVGAWYEPEEHPKKLEQDDKWELIRQGRCWACRGSGYRAGDMSNGKQVCLIRRDKKVNVQRFEKVQSAFEEEKA